MSPEKDRADEVQDDPSMDDDVMSQIEEFEAELAETEDELLQDSAPEPTSREGTDEFADEGSQREAEEPPKRAAEDRPPDQAQPEAKVQPKAKKYKAPDGNEYTWAEIEEKGLAEKILTQAHQTSHHQALYRETKEKLDALQQPPEEGEGAPVEWTPEKRKEYADMVQAKLLPIVEQHVENDEVEGDFVTYYPKFATRYAADRMMAERALGMIDQVLGVLMQDYNERTQGAQEKERADGFSGVIEELAEHGAPGLKDDGHRQEFLEWMAAPGSEGGAGLEETPMNLWSPVFAKSLYRTWLETTGRRPPRGSPGPRPELGGGLPASGRGPREPARDEFEEFEDELREGGFL